MKKEDMEMLEKLADSFAKSGMGNVKQKETALLFLVHSRELGIPYVFGLSNMYMQNGRIQYNISIYTALMEKHDKYRMQVINLADKECLIGIFDKKTGKKIADVSFGEKDAARVKVRDNGREVPLSSTSRYLSHPKSILFANAIRNAARVFFPDLFIPTTHPDSLDSIDNVETITTDFGSQDFVDKDDGDEKLEMIGFLYQKCDEYKFNNELVDTYLMKRFNVNNVIDIEQEDLRKVCDYFNDTNNVERLKKMFSNNNDDEKNEEEPAIEQEVELEVKSIA